MHRVPAWWQRADRKDNDDVWRMSRDRQGARSRDYTGSTPAGGRGRYRRRRSSVRTSNFYRRQYIISTVGVLTLTSNVREVLTATIRLQGALLTLWRPLLPYGYSYKWSILSYVKPSFVIFDIRALWRSGLSVRVPGCQKLQMTA